MNHTQWMERAVGAQRNLLDWSGHITRAFLDVSPHTDPPALSLFLLGPIAVGLSL
ncbi:hypothetical protein [Thiocapsa sp. UBA6158]|uniref:hypothetical protein n=1 Tax=Thiocapsa sp. UBA6158 TaxID=1947692 RepID=UPI0025F613C4|nr:hypothetical protein [Thiocapsa sp. UBA6158]